MRADTAALRLAAAEIVVLRAKIGALQDEAPEPAEQDVDDVVREKRDEARGFDDADEDQTP